MPGSNRSFSAVFGPYDIPDCHGEVVSFGRLSYSLGGGWYPVPLDGVHRPSAWANIRVCVGVDASRTLTSLESSRHDAIEKEDVSTVPLQLLLLL